MLKAMKEWIERKEIEEKQRLEFGIYSPPRDYVKELYDDFHDEYYREKLKTQIEILEQNKKYDELSDLYDSLINSIKSIIEDAMYYMIDGKIVELELSTKEYDIINKLSYIVDVYGNYMMGVYGKRKNH